MTSRGAVELPPNMLRRIYALARPNVQTRMHVLSRATRGNKNMPARVRCYLEGTGKYQKLWNELPDKLAQLVHKLKTLLPLHQTVMIKGFVPYSVSNVVSAAKKVYRKLRTPGINPQRVPMFDVVLHMLTTGGWRRDQMTDLADIYNTSMRSLMRMTVDLEAFMDKVLLWGQQKFHDMMPHRPESFNKFKQSTKNHRRTYWDSMRSSQARINSVRNQRIARRRTARQQ